MSPFAVGRSREVGLDQPGRTARSGDSLPDRLMLGPICDTDLIPSDPEPVAIGEVAKSNRDFVDGDAPLSQQVNNPQTRRGPQQARVKPGNARIGEPEFTTARRSDQ